MPAGSKFNFLLKTTTKFRFTIPRIQSKITGHAKMQKNVAHNQEKNQPIEAEAEMTKMMELTDENFKIAIINLLENIDKSMNVMKGKNGRHKKDPNETFEMKNAMPEI